MGHAGEIVIWLKALGEFVESMGVHSPRLAVSSSYRRKPVSRRPDWIPCQARNDGREHKTIPRGLPRSS